MDDEGVRVFLFDMVLLAGFEPTHQSIIATFELPIDFATFVNGELGSRAP